MCSIGGWRGCGAYGSFCLFSWCGFMPNVAWLMSKFSFCLFCVKSFFSLLIRFISPVLWLWNGFSEGLLALPALPKLKDLEWWSPDTKGVISRRLISDTALGAYSHLSGLRFICEWLTSSSSASLMVSSSSIKASFLLPDLSPSDPLYS